MHGSDSVEGRVRVHSHDGCNEQGSGVMSRTPYICIARTWRGRSLILTFVRIFGTQSFLCPFCGSFFFDMGRNFEIFTAYVS